jgi:hypothetical protein
MNAILQSVIEEASYGDLDLDRAAEPSWYHRPFTEEELTAHPDQERIRATIEAAVFAAVRQACVNVECQLLVADEAEVTQPLM